MAWTKEQLMAINTRGQNIIVSAGAGSGKTAVLTTRVLELIHNNIHIDELLILTFTNAAAEEMKDRIEKKLKDENNKEELKRISKAFITTFDSYASSIVKKYHYVLNIPKNINITNSSLLEMKKNEILNNTLEEYYKGKSNNFINLINMLCTKDDNSFKKDLLSFLNKIEIKTDKDIFLDNYIEQYYNDSFYNTILENYYNIIYNKIEELFDTLESIKNHFESDYYTKLYNTLRELKNLSKDELIFKIKALSLPMLPRNSEEETKDAKETLNNVLKELKEYTKYGSEKDIIDDYKQTKPHIETILSISKDYFSNLKKIKEEEGLYDFIDIAKLSLKLLKEHPEIKDEIKYSLKEIMVDEYQDTSDIQEEFLNLIENNNLYMVGDIKQSIYRFRNANPTIFKNKYLKYSKNDNGLKIDLLKNFRSRKEVLDDINLIFNPIMDLDIGSADYFSSHQMIFGNNTYEENKNNNQNYNMTILEYEQTNKDYSKEEIEFFYIAKDINNKINSHYQILDKETNKLRDITYKDFSIIMDRNSSFQLAKKILSYFNIPTTLYIDEDLNNSTEIYFIKNIITLLICIKNNDYGAKFRFAFTSIARSFLYDLNDEEIYKYITKNTIKESIIYKDFKEYANTIDSESIKNILESIIYKTNLYEKIISTTNIKESIHRIEKILSLSDDLNNSNYTIYEFNDFLDSILSSGNKLTIPTDITPSNSIKIMNIHKSKGLEFPITYFAGLYKAFSKQDFQKDIIYENNMPIYIPIFNEGIKETIIKLLIKKKIEKDDISEKIRLLYVALTRAKEKMIFILPKKEDLIEKKENDIIAKSIRLKYKSLADILYSIPKELAYYKKELTINDLNITKDYLLPKEKKRYTTITTLSNITDYKIDNTELQKESYSHKITTLLSKEEKKNIDLGLKFHEALEYYDFKSDSKKIEDKWIQSKIESMLSNKLFANIKDANILQEYEFIYTKDNTEYHGQIDLLLEYNDHIDIIDYKLNNLTDEAYIKQLNGYKKYIESISQKRVYTYLYSIISNEIKEVIM